VSTFVQKETTTAKTKECVGFQQLKRVFKKTKKKTNLLKPL
jgi:hypothetical protein